MTALAIAIVIVGVVCFGAFVLLGAWIDGRRQAVRNKGLHPVTAPDGQVEAREFEAKELEAKESEAREQEHGSRGRDNRQGN